MLKLKEAIRTLQGLGDILGSPWSVIALSVVTVYLTRTIIW